MKWNKKKGSFEDYDTPKNGEKCRFCGSTKFIFCKECNCWECSNDNCGEVYMKNRNTS